MMIIFAIATVMLDDTDTGVYCINTGRIAHT
jgi:hypothetical protein